MKLSFFLGVVSLFFSVNAFSVYGGGPLPAPMQGSPHVIRIETTFTCSAVVLNSRTLLTAAHCTEESGWDNDKINLIQPDTGDHQKNRISKVIRHPKYRIGFAENAEIDRVYTDIAVIKLTTPISFPHAETALATAQDLQVLSQLDIWLVANGSTAHSETSRNSGLQMTVRNYSYQILESQSQKSQSGPCINDSGGGYFVVNNGQVRLIGIQSSKNAGDCASAQSRGYVVDVPLNQDWIRNCLN